MAARAYDCLQGDLGASDNQQIRLSTQQFRRADKWAARIVDGAIFNDNVLSFAKTILFQLRRKRLIDSPIIAAVVRGCGPRNPTRGTFSACCARARNGHVSAALQATRPMNSRRLMLSAPEARTADRSNFYAYSGRGAMSALGQKRTFAVQNGMSALPPKADISQGAHRYHQREGARIDL